MRKNLSKGRKHKLKGIFNRSKSQINKILPIDMTLFILQFIRHPNDIGALTPSSVPLAEAMTRFISSETQRSEGKLYLEAGAGTGAFTEMIIKKLQPSDHLDIIEINPIFCERLKKKYSGIKNITIHAGSVLDWKPPYHYDAIVSSLPFNAFTAKLVIAIFAHYRRITKKKGYVSYCEYMALPGIRKMLLPSNAKMKLQKTLDAKNRFQEEFQISCEKVFANLPPAVVHHCQFH